VKYRIASPSSSMRTGPDERDGTNGTGRTRRDGLQSTSKVVWSVHANNCNVNVNQGEESNTETNMSWSDHHLILMKKTDLNENGF
jgi:hypothetical protein